jgi:tetratricopeptide (TPR) repeat protein
LNAVLNSIQKPSRNNAVATGDRARDQGEWAAAIASYQAALRVNPSAVWINVQIGHCLKELGDYPAARAAYVIFLELNQTDADIHLQMGHLCMRADAFDEAETWYLKAASLASPDDAVARDAALGVAAAGEGPIRRRRDDALALTDAGRFHDAYDRVRELVETDGQEDLVGILGNVCKEIRRLKEAASAYQRYRAFAATRTLELQFDAALQSGRLARQMGAPAEALSYFLQARRLFPACARPSCTKVELQKDVNNLIGALCSVLLTREGT